MDRKQALAQLWRETHSDFKGTVDGVRTVMVFRASKGSCLVTLDDLTDAEIADRVKAYTPPPRGFEQCAPDALAVGDVVKGNGALWRILDFSRTWRERTEMVEVECIDPQGVRPFYIGFRKQFVRQCRDGSWEREQVGERV